MRLGAHRLAVLCHRQGTGEAKVPIADKCFFQQIGQIARDLLYVFSIFSPNIKLDTAFTSAFSKTPAKREDRQN